MKAAAVFLLLLTLGECASLFALLISLFIGGVFCTKIILGQEGVWVLAFWDTYLCWEFFAYDLLG